MHVASSAEQCGLAHLTLAVGAPYQRIEKPAPPIVIGARPPVEKGSQAQEMFM